MSRLLAPCLMALLILSACTAPEPTPDQRLTFTVTFDADQVAEPVDGRLLLLLSTDSSSEPRFQITGTIHSQQVFGIDVENWAPGQPMTIGADAFGFPVASIRNLKADEYTLQVLFHRYETFTLATGHTVKLPMDRGEGQQWNRAPGNLFSTPETVSIDPTRVQNVVVKLDQKIPPIPAPVDTDYVKHVRIESRLLSEFWGRPMELGAFVLLPKGFDEHPEARYPLAVFHGHFPSQFGDWRTTPPDLSEPCVFSARFGVDCYNHIEQQEAYAFYQTWTGPDFPRFLVIEIQHPTPYYDDSYAVNSASQGPYGDAIMQELIPFIEKRFRGIGEGWARFTYGGSTGGWEALAVQILYPDDFNGCFAACPDPIDFRAYTTVNIYEHENAYYEDGPFMRLARPAHRDYLGHVTATVESNNLMELARGTNSRSGDQWDIWQATYSPMGDDGYPKPIWDKRTGKIDRQVAEYWREHYDLRYILERDWPKVGKKLEGKIHIYCGDMDNYYLNNAVYLMEEFLEKTKDPYYAGEVAYGDRAEHCWNGDPTQPNHISRLRYNTMYVPKMLERMRKTAPAGADLSSWRY